MTSTKFKRFGIPTALVVGGVTAGSLLAPIGLASAQDGDAPADDSSESESETPETTPESTEEDSEEGRRGHRRGHRLRAQKSEVLTETLGLDREAIRDGFEAGKTLSDMAAEQGVEVDDLRAALVDAATEAIDAAVDAGRLDESEAADKLASATERIDEMLVTVPDLENRTRHSHSHSHGRRGHGFGRVGNLDELSETLGLTADEVKAGLAEGKSLADLAEEQGVAIETLTEQLMSSIEERIDDAVEAGKIDEERAAEVKDGLDEMVDRAVNAERDGERMGRGKRGHHHGNRGFGGQRGENSDAESEIVESSI